MKISPSKRARASDVTVGSVFSGISVSDVSTPNRISGCNGLTRERYASEERMQPGAANGRRLLGY